jgi:hypothetical protein
MMEDHPCLSMALGIVEDNAEEVIESLASHQNLGMNHIRNRLQDTGCQTLQNGTYSSRTSSSSVFRSGKHIILYISNMRRGNLEKVLSPKISMTTSISSLLLSTMGHKE